MPIKVDIKELQQGEFLKLMCMISFTGKENESAQFTSNDFTVNDLATVSLHFKDQFAEPGLECKILAKSITCNVKVRVSCHDMDKPFYSEWVCTNNWKLIGYRRFCDLELENVYTTVVNICISTSTVIESPLARLYEDDDFIDFNLSADGGTVPVHRALLGVHSTVFRGMLTREWKEKTEGCIQLKGVTLQTLKHFKDYMYLRILPEEDLELEPLLLFASYYLIDDLKADCISRLVLKSGDWNGLLKFAIKNDIFELVRAIMLVNPGFTLKEKK